MDGEDQGVPGDPGDEWSDDLDSGGMRGWIPPDDRLWRHPSESGARSFGPSIPTSTSARPRPRPRSGPWIAGGATACVVLALVATGLAIMTAGSSDEGDPGGSASVASLTGEPTTEAVMDRMPDAAAIAGMVSLARPSLVALRVGAPRGPSVGTGLVTESGGIIVTASSLVSGARSITVIEADGTPQPAGVVGVDQRSGLAVLRISDDLPAASFDLADPATGSVAVAMALKPGAHSDAPPTAKVYAGAVLTAGRSMSSDPAPDLFSVTAVDAPLTNDDVGCPILDVAGQVSGILMRTKQSGGSTTAVFLPAELVLGVAQQLVTSGQMDHGWLGIETSDAGAADPTTVHSATTQTVVTTPRDGARLDVIDQNGPAATAGLLAGDVIVDVAGNPVHSAAELETRLYADPPGTQVDLGFVRGGTTMATSVILGDRASAVPGGDSSP